MPLPISILTNEARKLRQEGVSALQAGDNATARGKFERVVASGQGDAAVCSALAMACRNLGDKPATLAAAEKALGYDPTSLPSLILKGECLEAAGDARRATSFFALAIALAERARELPAPLARLVDQARAARDRINSDIGRHLRAELIRHGYLENSAHPRFRHSLDLLTGRKSRFSQLPRAYYYYYYYYYYPDLPDTQFYPRERFQWLGPLEAATDDICGELLEVLGRRDAFAPYIRRPVGVPENPGHPLLDSLDWSAHFLWKDGSPMEVNAKRCPLTLAALADLPLAKISGRTPSILFSQLKPGARIAPHTGFLNCRLICHLPLVVPPGCYLRVGNEEREWRKGEAWVFNDTIEHEARNDSDRPRVILIFDIWHPELTEEERGLVTVLMRAVDNYNVSPPSPWDD